MYATEKEASKRSRESMESARSETRKRKAACAWSGSERTFEGERDRIHVGVMTQGMEGDGVDSLWGAMSVIGGGQGTNEEAKEVRARVVAAVEERLQAGVLQEPLPQGETGWKEYVRKLEQGRRMGGPPEVEAWAAKNGYRVKVYRETKDGEGYRKIQEYGGEQGMTAGILWRKTRVYEVVWEQEETGEGSTTGEAGRAGAGGGAQVRVGAGGEQGHSVASGASRLSTCRTGSVGSAAGNEEEQQCKAAWAWKRREGALEGARERAEEGVLVEHMYGKDVNTLWEVLCALEGRPNSEEEVQRIRQGVATRVESRHNMREMEECLPQQEVSWQRYIQRTRQRRRMGGPPEVEAWAAEGGYKVAVYREAKSGNRYRKLVEYGEGTPLDAGILWTKRRTYAVLWGVRGRRGDAADVAAAAQGVLDSAQEGQGWPEAMPEGARRQVIPGDGKCLYWALSALDRAGGRVAAEEVRKGLTEGEMARPPESGWARRVMRDAGARTWDQYLDKVRRGKIWGGACEFGRWAQSKGCRVAMYQEWGPQGVYRKMAEVGEGKRTAAALLWSRRGGGHYDLLWPPGEEDAEAVAGADAEEGTESKGDAEVTMEEELAEEGPEKGGGGKVADGGAHVAGCASNTDPGGGGEVEVPGTGGPREGEEG